MLWEFGLRHEIGPSFVFRDDQIGQHKSSGKAEYEQLSNSYLFPKCFKELISINGSPRMKAKIRIDNKISPNNVVANSITGILSTSELNNFTARADMNAAVDESNPQNLVVLQLRGIGQKPRSPEKVSKSAPSRRPFFY